jgi:hypothetical protein
VSTSPCSNEHWSTDGFLYNRNTPRVNRLQHETDRTNSFSAARRFSHSIRLRGSVLRRICIFLLLLLRCLLALELVADDLGKGTYLPLHECSVVYLSGKRPTFSEVLTAQFAKAIFNFYQTKMRSIAQNSHLHTLRC